MPEAARARAAAYLITTSESSALHLERLQTRAADFDPDTRGRLLSGAMVPAAWVIQAQRFRAWFREAMRDGVRDGRHHPRAGDAVPRAAVRARRR